MHGNVSSRQALRLPNVLAHYPRSRSQFYADISNGLFPKPFKLGARSSAWFEHEVDAVVTAYAAGASTEQIRLIVSNLEAARLDLMSSCGETGAVIAGTPNGAGNQIKKPESR